MISTLLFDMDGLIFDTEWVYKSSWQYAAKQLGFDLNDDFYQGFIGVQDPQCEQMLCDKFGPSFDLGQFRVLKDQRSAELHQQGIDYKTGFPCFVCFGETKAPQDSFGHVLASATSTP